MSDRSTRVFGPASMPTLDNPVARASPWACKPGAGYWWRDLMPGLLIDDDALTVAHVYFDGLGIKDRFNNAWAMNGVVPQVQGPPKGAGTFSDTNYYSLGTGSDVLDFAGDFSGCVVYQSLAAQTNNGFVSDAAPYGAAGAGWRIMANPGAILFDTLGPGSAFTRITDVPLDVGMNAICFGRAGTTQHLKVNLRALASTGGSLVVPATGEPGRIGRYSEAGTSARQKIIYEIWLSTTTPSDALFTVAAQRVKDRLAALGVVVSW